MRPVLSLLVCVACAGHARRIQKQSMQGSREDAFSTLLLALSQEAAFQTSGPSVHLRAGNRPSIFAARQPAFSLAPMRITDRTRSLTNGRIRCCAAPEGATEGEPETAEVDEQGATEGEPETAEVVEEDKATDATRNETAAEAEVLEPEEPEDPEKVALKEKIAELEKKVVSARGDVFRAEAAVKDAGRNGFEMAFAKYEIFRRGAEAELETLSAQATSATMKELLSFVEAFEILQQEGKGTDPSTPVGLVHAVNGAAYMDLQRVLKKRKVTQFEVKAGDMYDSLRHQMLNETISEDVPKGTIIEAIEQVGWDMNGQAIRQPKVIVSAGPPPPPPEPEEEETESTEEADAAATQDSEESSETEGPQEAAEEEKSA